MAKKLENYLTDLEKINVKNAAIEMDAFNSDKQDRKWFKEHYENESLEQLLYLEKIDGDEYDRLFALRSIKESEEDEGDRG